MRTISTTCIAAALTAALAAGCGGDDKQPANTVKRATIESGAIHFEDALDDNGNGWLEVPDLVSFEGGRYVWQEVPPGMGGGSVADASLKEPPPEGLTISVDTETTAGAALRAVTCRELGTEELQEWYELGIDGRRAMIRRMAVDEPPEVLGSVDAPVENGRSVRLTGHCVPDGGKLVLALALDGRELVRATDPEPLPATRGGISGAFGLHAYQRPDSDGPADLTWDAFEVRVATVRKS